MNTQAEQVLKQTRLRTFDFLRGIAILGVIAVHTAMLFPSQISAVDFVAGLGKFGVQLFFFISALTMCHMWKLREGENNPIKKFYIRRFFRIAPLFWIAIPVYLLINSSEESYWLREGVGALQIILTATFLHGFLPDSINSVVPGGWSIAVEVTFYALFPYLIINIKKGTTFLLTAIIIWLLNVFIFKNSIQDFFNNYYEGNSAESVKNFLYFNFLNQSPIFLLGCYLYFTLNTRPKKIEAFIFIVWILIAKILRYFFNIEGFGFLVIYLTIGSFVYVSIKINIKFKIIELLGQKSYAIYLTHFLVLHYLQLFMPLKSGLTALIIAIFITILLSYILALFLYKFIELKFQNFVDVITKPKLSQ